MKALVIGSGGREHALCWKLRQSPLLEELYCAPANPGIAEVADPVPIPADAIHDLADFAAEAKIDLTVVGPELPLALGIVDEFINRGLPIFGPRRQAAELEGSKVFAKEFMKRHGIPTAEFEIVHGAEEARLAVRRFGFPVVLKADGLAAGKGVMIPHDEHELEGHLATFFDERRFGTAAERVVVEECLEGEEISFIAICDGERVLPVATSKDYKRLGDGDEGPNTGGMGAHSPAGVLGGTGSEILDRVIRPTVAGMDAENRRFMGVLYAGLMLTEDGPRVLEFNVRFGDPEAQPIFLRMEGDLLEVLASGAAGRFETPRLNFRKEAAACIVLASKGYPEKPAKGDVITGLEAAAGQEGVEIFQAGTAIKDGQLVAAGGRVLNVCASGATLRDALKRAYGAATAVRWDNRIFRHDIGRRVLNRAGS
ncbi:MAG: phosphoribosylamine--glycine ligase [bacterium]|nr:phosphoribosylamine--glycine ligase [bacterium]